MNVKEEMIKQTADAFAFKPKKKIDFITISRHAKPDFCAGMTIDEILDNYYVVPIYFK